MNSKAFLDELLKTGKDLAKKGQAIAEEKLQMPKEGEGRDQTLDGMKKGAIAAGVLALLLGTGAGRRVTGSALKIGSLAAIGGIGYKAYQNWLSQRGKSQQEMADDSNLMSFDELDEGQGNERSTILLKAMIAAAKSDGHVNLKEIAIIKEQITKLNLGDEIAALLEDEVTKPLDVKEVAALAENQAIATEIYLVSAVVTDNENPMEREYLETLARTMELPDALVAQLQSVKEDELT